MALEGGLFIYSSTAGNAWIFKIKGNGSIGEVIWSTTKWATGLNSFTALSNSVLFITKTTGKAWVFKLVNNDFVRLWSTMGYSKGISVTAANYLKNHNSTAHVADPPNGKQWILNHDGAKTVKVAHSQRWPKNISVQALVNQGSYILLLNPLTGEVWSNMVLIKSTFD